MPHEEAWIKVFAHLLYVGDDTSSSESGLEKTARTGVWEARREWGWDRAKQRPREGGTGHGR